MASKKIFITIPYFLPANPAGEMVKFVSDLVNEINEEIEYYIFCQDIDVNGAMLENVETNKWVEYNSHTQVWYAGPEKISDNIVRQVELQKPAIIFIVGFFSWHFNMVPLLFCKGPRKIVSTAGTLHPEARKQKKLGKWLYLNIFKLLEYHYKVDFQVRSESERNYIIRYFKNIPEVFIAENFDGSEKIMEQYREMFKLKTN